MTYTRKVDIFFKKDKLSISTHHLSLIVHDAFIPYFPYIYYDITIRLVYDYYVIHFPCLSYPTPIPLRSDKKIVGLESAASAPRITSTASIANSITCYFYVRRLRFLRKVRFFILNKFAQIAICALIFQ